MGGGPARPGPKGGDTELIIKASPRRKDGAIHQMLELPGAEQLIFQLGAACVKPHHCA